MSLKRLPRCLRSAFLVGLLAISPAVRAETPSDARLQQACDRLQAQPLDAAELQVLLDGARQSTNAPSLRSRAMAAYSLSLLLRGDTNAFERAAAAVRTSFPESEPLITVGSRDAYATCSDCAGGGSQTTLCPSCMGTGTCKTCGGTGRVAGGTCSSCKGKRVCARCRGQKRIEAVCAACNGTGSVFQPSAKVRENYAALLAALAAQCQANMRFDERFHVASKERDPVKRAALFESLLSDFPKRDDFAAVQALRDAAVANRDEQAAQQKARDTREREAREAEELMRLRESPDLNAAIATLDTYLREHIGTSAAPDLRALQQELLTRRNRKQLIANVLKGFGALVGLSVLLGLLKKIVFRKKPESLGPLPGMEHIDKRDFTDPLTLTAKESRTRSHPSDT